MDEKAELNGRFINLLDTTLRDGTQGERISLSLDDKLRIAEKLDAFGMGYIEGGWPGSNPKDLAFFRQAARRTFQNARLTAFGSTRRAHNKVDEDANIQALLQAETPAVSIFGKSWLLHVTCALGIAPQKNLELIYDSVHCLKQHGREVIYDAEHFFDGYLQNPEYALSTLLAAQAGGADVLCLCDTNGGTLPHDLEKAVRHVLRHVDAPVGIHAHNDSDLAVANSLAAVRAGATHVQGTVNGYGERTGNANLCSVIANLKLKMKCRCVPPVNVKEITALSRFVREIANAESNERMPYVGKSAFAHKGGIHVSAVMKENRTYEHVAPESVGNERRVLVSDLSGRSNVFFKAQELNIDLTAHEDRVPDVVTRLKELENAGYQFEAAEGSFELLTRKITGQWDDPFELEGFRVLVERNESGHPRSEASVRLKMGESIEHTAAEGCGPVHALDQALRKALRRFFPEIDGMGLVDYKVRDLDAQDGVYAKVRVIIESAAGEWNWRTVGVSDNILEASWLALMDSFSYYLMKLGKEVAVEEEVLVGT